LPQKHPLAKGMIAKRWQASLGYAAMSLFVAWHALALVIPPAPDSTAKQALMQPLYPYLMLLRLNNTWDFFAPTVSEGQAVRYLVEDATGATHSFMPMQDFGFFDPRYWWTSSFHSTIISSPDDYADRAAALFCKEHASLKPVAVTVIHVLQKDFSVADQLAGRLPTAPPFIRETVLGRAACKAA
jgi:hypothetical protein